MKIRSRLLALVALLSTPGAAALQLGGRPGVPDEHASTCQVISRRVPSQDPEPLLGGGFLIQASFHPNVTQAQQAVILQAIDDWDAVISGGGQMVNPYPIGFANGPLGGGTLAQANTAYDDDGVLHGSTITIDNDGTSVFYIDPTPGDSAEFDANGVCTDTACQTGADLLTVMRHEIGHAIGWTGAFSASPSPLVTELLSGTTFDPARLNIAMATNGTSHSNPAAFPGGLMNPALGNGQRIGIALYPDASFLARVIDYPIVMRFLDKGVPSGDGSADAPFGTILDAFVATPAGLPILAVPGVYDHVSTVPFVLDTPHFVDLAQGGSALFE